MNGREGYRFTQHREEMDNKNS